VEEGAKLTVAIQEFGNDWGRVAELVPGRTNTLCSDRWSKHLDPNAAEQEHDASDDEGRDWI
jgi:hypothetical protein